jgi:hypothetical protein
VAFWPAPAGGNAGETRYLEASGLGRQTRTDISGANLDPSADIGTVFARHGVELL